VAWLSSTHEEDHLDQFLSKSRTLVAEVDAEAEVVVTTAPGSFRCLQKDLPFCAVTTVTCSRIARKQGIAARLAAQSVADAAHKGEVLAGLGMFDQGFYDKLGFGAAGRTHFVKFDPADLTLNRRTPMPKRFGTQDVDRLYRAAAQRRRTHGGVLLPQTDLELSLRESGEGGFILGFTNETEEITHFLAGGGATAEHGPYRVSIMVYQNAEQLLDLFALLQSLSDQVYLINMMEPPGITVQDLLRRPLRRRSITDNTKYANRSIGSQYYQVRILNLPGCLAGTHVPCPPIRFNLRLHDPIRQLLPGSHPWQGCAGDWVVTLGPQSDAEPGTDPALHTMECSIAAFTRLWLGVRPAWGLTVTDGLQAPQPLLQQFEEHWRLPEPQIDWEF
jgi:hypothetical protein